MRSITGCKATPARGPTAARSGETLPLTTAFKLPLRFLLCPARFAALHVTPSHRPIHEAVAPMSGSPIVLRPVRRNGHPTDYEVVTPAANGVAAIAHPTLHPRRRRHACPTSGLPAARADRPAATRSLLAERASRCVGLDGRARSNRRRSRR